MTLHFRPLPKAHNAALKSIKAQTTRKLMTEIAIERAATSKTKRKEKWWVA